MAKSPDAPYEVRGAGWLKVKPVHTLDLVVLAVEWGSGRAPASCRTFTWRATRDGRVCHAGQTFKGMTDAMLDWQTTRFMELADGPTDGYVVKVRPEQVVEIAFDGVQGSSRYPGGMALRFARVLRYRDDKGPAEADTIDTARALYDRGGHAETLRFTPASFSPVEGSREHMKLHRRRGETVATPTASWITSRSTTATSPISVPIRICRR